MLSNYLLDSIECKFDKTVRVYSIIIQAVKKLAGLAKIDLEIGEKGGVSFSMFPANLSNLNKGFTGKYYAMVTEKDVSKVLAYL